MQFCLDGLKGWPSGPVTWLVALCGSLQEGRASGRLDGTSGAPGGKRAFASRWLSGHHRASPAASPCSPRPPSSLSVLPPTAPEPSGALIPLTPPPRALLPPRCPRPAWGQLSHSYPTRLLWLQWPHLAFPLGTGSCRHGLL